MFKRITEKVIFNGAVKTLEHFAMLKLLPEEEVLLVERQHWIVLLVPMLVNIIIFLALFTAIRFVFLYAHLLPLQMIPTISLYLFLLIILLLGILAHYIFMTWYYQFYIITTKRIIHIHFFRVGGYFLEELFFSRLREKEVRRSSSNFIYDMLDIQDITITYDAYETESGFIFVFKTPANAERIESLVDSIISKKKEI